MRDNIAKFINNAATQIAGEESNGGLNEYGFYFDKTYWNEDRSRGFIFHEDGFIDMVDENGNVLISEPAPPQEMAPHFSNNGKTLTNASGDIFTLKE